MVTVHCSKEINVIYKDDFRVSLYVHSGKILKYLLYNGTYGYIVRILLRCFLYRPVHMD